MEGFCCTPCEDPGRPEGTVSLSKQDGSVEYRLLFQGTDLPRLVQVRSTGETRTCRSAAFSYSEAGDFLGGDRKISSRNGAPGATRQMSAPFLTGPVNSTPPASPMPQTPPPAKPS